jgi:hypothetical protein
MAAVWLAIFVAACGGRSADEAWGDGGIAAAGSKGGAASGVAGGSGSIVDAAQSDDAIDAAGSTGGAAAGMSLADAAERDGRIEAAGSEVGAADGMAGGSGSVADAPQGLEAAFDARSRIGTTGVVYCGPLNCGLPGFCCVYDWPVCIVEGVMGGGICPAGRDQIHCDDRTDCTPGQICCAVDTGVNGYAEARCATDCQGGVRRQILCDNQILDPCPSERPACANDDQSIFQGKAYCHP